MRRRLAIAAGAALLVALPFGWYLGSPWWTLWRMREAARAGDWRMVASYVDVDAIVKATRADAVARLREELASPCTNIFGRPSECPMADDLRWELHKGRTELLKETVGNIPYDRADLVAGPFLPRPRVRRHSLSEFDVLSPATPSPATFIFRRHGLGWKLDGVKWGWPEGWQAPPLAESASARPGKAKHRFV